MNNDFIDFSEFTETHSLTRSQTSKKYTNFTTYSKNASPSKQYTKQYICKTFIFKCTDTKDQKIFVDTFYQICRKECQYLHSYKHFSLSYNSKPNPTFLARYIGQTTLENALRTPSTLSTFKIEDFFNCLFAVSEGMLYLHNHLIYHGNLCPSNILIDEANQFYLSDFGLYPIKKIYYSENELFNTSYKDPLMSDKGPTLRNDIYSFGVLMCELLLGYSHSNSKTKPEPIEFFLSNNNDVKYNIFPSFFSKMIKSCISTTGNDRPTFKQIRESFKNANQDAYGINIKNMYNKFIKVNYTLTLADKNDVIALNKAGKMYEKGKNVKKDLQKAIQYYKKAAVKSYSEGQYNYGILLRKIYGNSPEEMSNSKTYLELSANQSNIHGMASYGMILLQGGVEEKKLGKYFLKRSADAGYSYAQLHYGLALLEGTPTDAEVEDGLRYLKMAMDSANGDAFYNYGLLLQSGKFVEKDERLSRENFKIAARLGCAEAEEVLKEKTSPLSSSAESGDEAEDGKSHSQPISSPNYSFREKPPNSPEKVVRKRKNPADLPFKVSPKITLISLGDIVFDRPKYHSEKYIFPVGYVVEKEFTSIDDPTKQVAYRASILDGGEFPLFRVETLDENKRVFEGPSASKPWKDIIVEIENTKKRLGMPTKKDVSAQGPIAFGLNLKDVRYLIENLNNANLCTNYKPKKTEKTEPVSEDEKKKKPEENNDEEEAENEESSEIHSQNSSSSGSFQCAQPVRSSSSSSLQISSSPQISQDSQQFSQNTQKSSSSQFSLSYSASEKNEPKITAEELVNRADSCEDSAKAFELYKEAIERGIDRNEVLVRCAELSPTVELKAHYYELAINKGNMSVFSNWRNAMGKIASTTTDNEKLASYAKKFEKYDDFVDAAFIYKKAKDMANFKINLDKAKQKKDEIKDGRQQFIFGLLLKGNNELDLAKEMLSKACENNVQGADLKLKEVNKQLAEKLLEQGIDFYEARNGTKYSVERAMSMFRQASELGCPRADYYLGLHFPDNEYGKHHMMMAVESGDPEGQYLYANRLRDGTAGERDFEKSMKYYKLAALQGHVQASYEYGCRKYDNATSQDERFEGLYFLKKSGDKEHKESASMYSRIVKSMSEKEYHDFDAYARKQDGQSISDQSSKEDDESDDEADYSEDDQPVSQKGSQSNFQMFANFKKTNPSQFIQSSQSQNPSQSQSLSSGMTNQQPMSSQSDELIKIGDECVENNEQTKAFDCYKTAINRGYLKDNVLIKCAEVSPTHELKLQYYEKAIEQDKTSFGVWRKSILKSLSLTRLKDQLVSYAKLFEKFGDLSDAAIVYNKAKDKLNFQICFEKAKENIDKITETSQMKDFSDLLYEKDENELATTLFERFKKSKIKGTSDNSNDHKLNEVDSLLKEGIDLFEGRNGIKANQEKAMDFFKRASKFGCPRADFYIGKYYKGKYGADSLKKSAEAGDPEGQNRYADYLKDGIIVEKDINLAMHYYKLAADQGQPNAAYEYGRDKYLNAENLAERKEGESYLKRAAELMHPDAIFVYSMVIRKRDPENAERYFRFAVEKGSKLAIQELKMKEEEEERARQKASMAQNKLQRTGANQSAAQNQRQAAVPNQAVKQAPIQAAVNQAQRTSANQSAAQNQAQQNQVQAQAARQVQNPKQAQMLVHAAEQLVQNQQMMLAQAAAQQVQNQAQQQQNQLQRQAPTANQLQHQAQQHVQAPTARQAHFQPPPQNQPQTQLQRQAQAQATAQAPPQGQFQVPLPGQQQAPLQAPPQAPFMTPQRQPQPPQAPFTTPQNQQHQAVQIQRSSTTESHAPTANQPPLRPPSAPSLPRQQPDEPSPRPKSDSVSPPAWTKEARATVIQKLMHTGVTLTYDGAPDWPRFRSECGFGDKTVSEVSSFVDSILSDTTLNDTVRQHFTTLTRLRRVFLTRKEDELLEYLTLGPRWLKTPHAWTPQHELFFLREIANRGWGICGEILTHPTFDGVFEENQPPQPPPFMTQDKSVIKRVESVLTAIEKNTLESLRAADESKKSAVEKLPAIDVTYRADGSPVLPINASQSVTLISLGRIVSRPGFHTARYIFPAGFKVIRTYTSIVDPSKKARYACEIIEGRIPGPLFRVVLEEDPSFVFEADTVTGVVRKITDKIKEIKTENMKNAAITGSKFFGLDLPLTAYLIQRMPGASECVGYVMRKFEAPSQRPSTPRTPLRKTASTANTASVGVHDAGALQKSSSTLLMETSSFHLPTVGQGEKRTQSFDIPVPNQSSSGGGLRSRLEQQFQVPSGGSAPKSTFIIPDAPNGPQFKLPGAPQSDPKNTFIIPEKNSSFVLPQSGPPVPPKDVKQQFYIPGQPDSSGILLIQDNSSQGSSFSVYTDSQEDRKQKFKLPPNLTAETDDDRKRTQFRMPQAPPGGSSSITSASPSSSSFALSARGPGEEAQKFRMFEKEDEKEKDSPTYLDLFNKFVNDKM